MTINGYVKPTNDTVVIDWGLHAPVSTRMRGVYKVPLRLRQIIALTLALSSNTLGRHRRDHDFPVEDAR